jgi:hypothetical protein
MFIYKYTKLVLIFKNKLTYKKIVILKKKKFFDYI